MKRSKSAASCAKLFAAQLAFMEFALAAAVLAGFKPHQIVNFLPVDELRK
jgi:hypothetical protein